MPRYGNGPMAKRLLALYDALQRRETPVVEVAKMARVCGINPRQILAGYFCGGARP
ncbi:hypothetical protein [Pseudomonas graminis]|uniref:hypothetical protein n=1 Tax=Pseudomonas graminis TaxID=158627 RepID=UPI001428C48A|nr:hypothetical protein [Pseudomonas graminis]